jgi:DNA-binding MarR family transcriptional regulator/GNAT superfamily N-acetyltransferase
MATRKTPPSARKRSAATTPPDAHVAAVRRFNRFYTRLVGALGSGHLHTRFSLTEARVLYELGQLDGALATDIQRELGLDAGYLSRMLRRFVDDGLVERATSEMDRRRVHLRLTRAGRAAFARLDARAAGDVKSLLQPLDLPRRRLLLGALERVETLLGAPTPTPEFELRQHAAGDMGFIVHRQAILYEREYGWNWEYEALISRIVADFLERYDPAVERCWIAERAGETVGSVFLIRHPEREGVAKLRLLYVEPDARGLGIGRRLVSECTQFARSSGYRAITLWTNSVLVSARRLYDAEGYALVGEEANHMFGHDLVSQTWELSL